MVVILIRIFISLLLFRLTHNRFLPCLKQEQKQRKVVALFGFEIFAVFFEFGGLILGTGCGWVPRFYHLHSSNWHTDLKKIDTL